MDSKSIVRFVRPWVQIPPTPPKARQPLSFPGFLFAAESLVQINKMYIPECTLLTHTIFYERGFEKYFQALYNSNRYNREWKHSDKKRKNN